MNKKQAYNKGVESGLKVAQKVIENEIEAMEYLQSRIDLIVNGHEEMKSAVNRLIQDADEAAINTFFGVCNDVRPCDLKEHEKMILLNILATLSSADLNDNQKRYYNNLRHHINLQGFSPDQNYDFRYIEKIESIKAIKVIAKAVRIFLYLKDNSMNGVYMHEDDLFSHFELRSFDEIDATIELLSYLFGTEGLVDFYGEFDNIEEFQENKTCYINVEKKEHISISNESAQIYFKDCFVYDDNLRYIESASYIIYSRDNQIMGLHKRTCVKSVLVDNIENVAELFKQNQIVAYYDMVYFVLGNELFYLDLNTMRSGAIFHIEQQKDSMGDAYEITELEIYKSQKIIYRNGYRYYITDLQAGISSTQQLNIDALSRDTFCDCTRESDFIPNSYFIRGDYIYFISYDNDLDDISYVKYILKRYGIFNGQTTNVTKSFGRHSMSDSIRAMHRLSVAGMYEKYYYCIFAYEGMLSNDNLGFDCFYINTDEMAGAEVHNFYIWNSRVYQFEQYKDHLIYVNADKGYSLTVHNFIGDKKKVLRRNYGKDDKDSTFSFFDRLYIGKSHFQRPNKYMRLGKWLWIKEPGKWEPEIIQICE